MAALIHQLAWYQTLDPRLASAGGSSAIVSVGHERSSEHPRASRHYQRTLRRRFGTAPKARVGSRYWRLAASGGSRLASGSLSPQRDRKSTRLNSSHGYISYAVFCLKKKKKTIGS